jgi:hypothetical protein
MRATPHLAAEVTGRARCSYSTYTPSRKDHGHKDDVQGRAKVHAGYSIGMLGLPGGGRWVLGVEVLVGGTRGTLAMTGLARVVFPSSRGLRSYLCSFLILSMLARGSQPSPKSLPCT